MSTYAAPTSRHLAYRATAGVEPAWVAWHSKVRIAVLTVALFMALC